LKNNNKEYDHLIHFIEKKFFDDKKSEKSYCKLEKSNSVESPESFSTNLIYVTIDSYHSNNKNNSNNGDYLNSTLEYSKVKAIHIDQKIS
jgi:hypothetical protein